MISEPLNVFVCGALARICIVHVIQIRFPNIGFPTIFRFQAAAAAAAAVGATATFYIVTFIESIKQAENQYLRVQMCLFFFPFFRL